MKYREIIGGINLMNNFLLFKLAAIAVKWRPTMKSLFKCLIITVCILMTTGFWSILVHAIESNGDEVINGVCISLKVDSNQILLNGESKTIKNIPFLKNNIAYVPLRDIVELCGGIVEYIPSRRSVIIALKNKVGDTVRQVIGYIW